MMNRIIRFFKKLYMKELTCRERQWLYFTKVGFPKSFGDPDYEDALYKRYPPMTNKQYRKMCEREELYRCKWHRQDIVQHWIDHGKNKCPYCGELLFIKNGSLEK